MAEKISPVTQRTLDGITKQKAHIEKIKVLSEFIGKCDEEDEIHFDNEDIDIIKRALACHWSVIQLDISRQEEAIKNGSEDGNLRSQSEKQILNGCLGLLQDAVDYFGEYLEFIGYSPDPGDEESEFEYSLTYGQIVNQLFLWNTSHSGGTSTAAKCRELGVDYGKSVKFTISHEWENE
ncbi:MAG: hypothetical protein LUG99_00280 [Lachnospiraceae bacterium]|nr:hypothetical protein [Lachnospiraceae bacterium]